MSELFLWSLLLFSTSALAAVINETTTWTGTITCEWKEGSDSVAVATLECESSLDPVNVTLDGVAGHVLVMALLDDPENSTRARRDALRGISLDATVRHKATPLGGGSDSPSFFEQALVGDRSTVSALVPRAHASMADSQASGGEPDSLVSLYVAVSLGRSGSELTPLLGETLRANVSVVLSMLDWGAPLPGANGQIIVDQFLHIGFTFYFAPPRRSDGSCEYLHYTLAQVPVETASSFLNSSLYDGDLVNERADEINLFSFQQQTACPTRGAQVTAADWITVRLTLENPDVEVLPTDFWTVLLRDPINTTYASVYAPVLVRPGEIEESNAYGPVSTVAAPFRPTDDPRAPSDALRRAASTASAPS